MSIEDKVCNLIQERKKLGLEKYGTSVERTDLSEKEWLQHAQEEALDFAIYLEKLKQEACVLSKDDMVVLVALINAVETTQGLSEVNNFKEKITSVRQKLKDAINLD